VTTIDLVPHMDAGDAEFKAKWTRSHDERPLTEFGRREADAQCEALAGEQIDALYSSPALRARQTIAPLAERLGLEINLLDGIGDLQTWHGPDGWDAKRDLNVATHAAGCAMAALWDVQLAYPEGHVVACSHGHVIPALVSFLIAAHGLQDVPEVTQRGQWYRIEMDGADVVEIERLEVAEFPG